jgi:hypothetical protein
MIIIIPFIAEYSSTGVLGRTQVMAEANFDKYAIDGALGHIEFQKFIIETVCLTSIDNEAVLRDQDIHDNLSWTKMCTGTDPFTENAVIENQPSTL